MQNSNDHSVAGISWVATEWVNEIILTQRARLQMTEPLPSGFPVSCCLHKILNVASKAGNNVAMCNNLHIQLSSEFNKELLHKVKGESAFM